MAQFGVIACAKEWCVFVCLSVNQHLINNGGVLRMGTFFFPLVTLCCSAHFLNFETWWWIFLDSLVQDKFRPIRFLVQTINWHYSWPRCTNATKFRWHTYLFQVTLQNMASYLGIVLKRKKKKKPRNETNNLAVLLSHHSNVPALSVALSATFIQSCCRCESQNTNIVLFFKRGSTV